MSERCSWSASFGVFLSLFIFLFGATPQALAQSVPAVLSDEQIPPLPKHTLGEYGSLGVSIADTPLPEQPSILVGQPAAILVNAFSVPASAAERAGVRIGDFILRVNKAPVTTARALIEAVRQFPIGETITVSLLRGNQLLDVNVKLMDRVSATWRAAYRGHIGSMRMVAQWFGSADGFDVDHNKSVNWYSRAAYSGDAESMLALAQLAEKGFGLGGSLPANVSRLWRERATNAGSTQAWFELGRDADPDYTTGTRSNVLAAVRAYNQAADGGSIDAAAQLCRLFFEGNRVERDDQRAHAYCAYAANGFVHSMLNLSLLHAYGRIPDSNMSLAAKLFLEAVRSNNASTTHRIASLRTQLPPQLVRELQKLLVRERALKGRINGRLDERTYRAIIASSAKRESWLVEPLQGAVPKSSSTFKSVSITEKERGAHSQLINGMLDAVLRLCAGGRCQEAGLVAADATELAVDLFGQNNERIPSLLYNLGQYFYRYRELALAEIYLKKSLSLKLITLANDDPLVANSQKALAAVLLDRGLPEQAAPLLRAARQTYGKHTNKHGLQEVHTMLELGRVNASTGDNHSALTLATEALAKLRKDFRSEILVIDEAKIDVAMAEHGLGNFDAARQILQQLLKVELGTLASAENDPQTVDNLNLVYFLKVKLAKIYNNLGIVELGALDLTSAESSFRRSLLFYQQGTTIRDSPFETTVQANLAQVYGRQKRWREALTLLDTALLQQRVYSRRQINTVAGGVTQSEGRYRDRRRGIYEQAVKYAYRVGLGSVVPLDMAAAFTWAQLSEFGAAAAAIQKSASRSEFGTAASPSVRKWQDLVEEGRKLDAQRVALSSLTNLEAVDAHRGLVQRLEQLSIEIRAAEQDATRERPGLLRFSAFRPLSLSEVQAALGQEEALVYVVPTEASGDLPAETFIWFVTQQDARWVRSGAGPEELRKGVATLRCGLDEQEWATPTQSTACTTLLGLPHQQLEKGRPLPFDLGVAHDLYLSLFGDAEDLIKGKRLLVVSGGALTSLPLQVLVTEKPGTALPTEFAGYQKAAWLARSYPIVGLPSVSSLKALRSTDNRVARAPLDYFGLGNPTLEGIGQDCRTPKVAIDSCRRKEPSIAIAESVGIGRATIDGRGGRRSTNLTTFFAKGAAPESVLERVRELCPLPDSGHEIRCIAEHFKPSATTIRLAADATETELKKLSSSGELARYRVIHFATHGLLAGDVELIAERQGEPALVMTPPAHSNGSEDDGLLTSSEVANLKLNADWVVLSACNTAAGDGRGAEALSGLAAAFLYAQARSLLVSHWPVYSDAAVRLTTRTFDALEADPKVGRAETLQIAMVELMDDPSEPDNSHPAVWAPFVIVGEGAR